VGVLSCTGSLAGYDGTSTILTVVCKDAYYKSAINSCKSCNLEDTLVTSNGNKIAG